MSAANHHSPPSSPGASSSKRPRIGSDSPAADRAEPLEKVDATTSTPRQHPKDNKKGKRAQKKQVAPIDPVLLADLLQVLGWDKLPDAQQPPSEAQTLGQRLWPKEAPVRLQGGKGKGKGKPEPTAEDEEGSNEWKFTEAEFKVVGLSSHGDGLAVHPEAEVGAPEWAVIIPFTLPGDRIRARVTRNLHYHSYAEPLELPTSSTYSPGSTSGYSFPLEVSRDPSLVGCKYFTQCAGCQYQSLAYPTQLALKRLVVQKAMRNFSGLVEGSDWPEVGETIPSPQQYGYRTKITPHFDLPKVLQTGKKGRQIIKEASSEEQALNGGAPPALGPEHDFPIGFNEACRSKIMDIEECPIATPVINAHMPEVRRSVKEGIKSFKRGATLLFRDSLEVVGAEAEGKPAKGKLAIKELAKADVSDKRICVTEHHRTITEKVGDLVFQFPAGSFFQNNSSILVPLTQYAKDQVRELGVAPRADGGETYLVDAYCGSGLFSLALADSFTKVLGIEIDPQSIAFATHNARTNDITNATFHAGASESIFQSATKELAGKGDRTTLIVDPPRKGCDLGFLKQVVEFRPKVVLYVSCNVHTMAENVGDLIRLTAEAMRKEGLDADKEGYKIRSVRAIDLFPQTHHAEGLLVLMRGE